MQLKDFLAILRKTNDSHVIMNDDGEPIAAILPFDRYRELVGGWHVRSHAASGRRTIPLPSPPPAPAMHEMDDEVQPVDEPHFQFEPLPDDEDLT